MQTRMTLSEAYRILGLSTDATWLRSRRPTAAGWPRPTPIAGGPRPSSSRSGPRTRSCWLSSEQRAPGGAPGGGPRAGPDEERCPSPRTFAPSSTASSQSSGEHQRWAEEETLRQLAAFQAHMTAYIQNGQPERVAPVQQRLSRLVECNTQCIIYEMQRQERRDPAALRELVHGEHPGGVRRPVPQGPALVRAARAASGRCSLSSAPSPRR